MKPLKDRYQRKTQHEHILLRPDSYIGSVEITEKELWVKEPENTKMKKKTIAYVPGLYKIFDEILVNAADNYKRDNKTNVIKVEINKETGFLSVFNNGMGIPVEIHEEEKIYIPEMIFGELLTGSNFDDNEQKVTGGRNGFGAKLTNIYSKTFWVEVADPYTKKILKVTWKNNMTEKLKLEFSEYKKKEAFTKVSFFPDYKRFNLKNITDDIYELFSKRVYDIAGSLNGKVKVFLNDEYIPIKSFEDYVNMYLSDDENTMKLNFKSDRWNIVLSNSGGSFEHISFVNSINTIRGGAHVNYIIDQIVEKVSAEIKKRKPKLTIKNPIIKNNLYLFVNCLINNPVFDSQTKENLTMKTANFGSVCELDKNFLKKLMQSELIEQIILNAELKENMKLNRGLKGKKKTRLLGIKKLEDANMAGSKQSAKCLLILTEGDSAKSLAMAGLEVIGRDFYGFFH
jgi:DNA topoisomerase-2